MKLTVTDLRNTFWKSHPEFEVFRNARQRPRMVDKFFRFHLNYYFENKYITEKEFQTAINKGLK
jgi:hypothetical protein